MSGPFAFLAPETPIGRKIAAFPWVDTPLGPIEHWPPALRITVGLVVRSGFPKCLCWGQEMTAIYNDAFGQLLGGKGECLGKPFPVIWSEAWPQIETFARRALRGRTTFIPDFPLEIDRGEGVREMAFFTFAYSPVVDENGDVRGFMDTVIETTHRVQQEQDAIIRNRELRHRIKNSYSLISALASQTFRESSDPDDIRARLLGRVQALGRAQDVLGAGASPGGDMRAVMTRALSPILDVRRDRLHLEGPGLMLTDSQAFALSLAIHELLTNAVKYGALCSERGRIHIRWRAGGRSGGDGPLTLEWRESGGPRVGEPKASGFGTFLIKDALAAAFSGEVRLDYRPAGFRLQLTARDASRFRPAAH